MSDLQSNYISCDIGESNDAITFLKNNVIANFFTSWVTYIPLFAWRRKGLGTSAHATCMYKLQAYCTAIRLLKALFYKPVTSAMLMQEMKQSAVLLVGLGEILHLVVTYLVLLAAYLENQSLQFPLLCLF